MFHEVTPLAGVVVVCSPAVDSLTVIEACHSHCAASSALYAPISRQNSNEMLVPYGVVYWRGHVELIFGDRDSL